MPDHQTEFVLATRLAADCHQLGKFDSHLVLLMDNALVPWFILVPQTSITELCDLPDSVQQSLNSLVNRLCLHIRERWQVEKLNVAAIGNVVKQLHVHVVGRQQQDYCWPGVVWGRTEKQAYRSEQVEVIQADLLRYLGDGFTCHPLHQESSR